MQNKQGYWISFMIILIIIPLPSVFPHPPEEDDCSTCHTDGNYSIQTNSNLTLYMGQNVSFSINISATGRNVQVWAHPQARDNQKFTFLSVLAILDNGINDQDPSNDSLITEFRIITPFEQGTYKLLIFARSPEEDLTQIVFLEFTLFVDDKYADQPPSFQKTLWVWIQSHIFSHLNIYLGTLAILSLGIGTVLMEINQKHVKIHGKLAMLALMLTLLNVSFSVSESLSLFSYWIQGEQIDWVHLTHLGIGIIGIVAGILGAIQGIAGHPMKKWGYVALGCWTFNFLFGIIYWGIGV